MNNRRAMNKSMGFRERAMRIQDNISAVKVSKANQSDGKRTLFADSCQKEGNSDLLSTCSLIDWDNTARYRAPPRLINGMAGEFNNTIPETLFSQSELATVDLPRSVLSARTDK